MKNKPMAELIRAVLPATNASRRLRMLLLAGLVLANILIMVFSAYSLYRSRTQYEQSAQSLTQNITSALDVNVTKSIEKLDLALGTVVYELERQLAQGGIRDREISDFLAFQERRLPEVEALRVSRSDGVVILGRGVVKEVKVSWADRDDFIFHRDHENSGLQITKPRIGRVAKQYIIGLSRRYNYPDGRFAGTVSAPIAVDYFTQLLSKFDAGPKGTLLLRDSELGLITRVPPLPDNPAGQVGNHVVSDDFRRVFESGVSTATNFTSASPDGEQRIFTFHKMHGVPLVTIVATSKKDYLRGWTEEVYRTTAVAGGFLLLSLVLGWSQLLFLRQAERHNNRIEQSYAFVNNILNSLGDQVAVIDSTGVITAVNLAWRRFAAENGAPTGPDAVAVDFVGTNYLDICRGAVNQPNGDESQAVFEGVKSVLLGTQDMFSMQYPCHSPNEQRWFNVVVMPLVGYQQGAVVIHQNVTAQFQAQAQLRASEEHFRMLAENMSDIVWKIDRHMRFAYVNDADRVVRGFERDEVVGSMVTEALGPAGKAVLARITEARKLAESSGERGQSLVIEIPILCKEGGEVWIELSTMPTYDADGEIVGFQGVGRDISDRKRREQSQEASQYEMANRLHEIARQKEEYQQQAIRDPLTGLFNRRYLDETLERELARGYREGYPVAVIMLDLDHFKHINDQFSHAAGDVVLRTMADLLKAGSRESDVVCRFGGEEFVAVMPGMSAVQAFERVESWRVTLQTTTVVYGDFQIHTTFSAGIAGFPEHGASPEDLLARSDAMLYAAKRNGRNRIGLPA